MKIKIRVRDSGNNEVVDTIDTASEAPNQMVLTIMDLLRKDKTVIVEKERVTTPCS